MPQYKHPLGYERVIVFPKWFLIASCCVRPPLQYLIAIERIPPTGQAHGRGLRPSVMHAELAPIFHRLMNGTAQIPEST